jgi:adenylosuccinate synthase
LKNKIIVALGGEALKYEAVRDEYRGYYLKLKPYIKELFSLVQDGLKTGKNFLLEQAMGTFLDTDWGTYPFVTASTTIPSAASAGIGNSSALYHERGRRDQGIHHTSRRRTIANRNP